MNYLYYIYAEFLMKHGVSETIAMITFPILPFIIVAVALLIAVIFLVLAERKILALFTQRKGPNRVGLWGILQTVADALKLLCKENITPTAADRFLFNLAPLLVFIPVMVIWGLIPYSAEFEFMSTSVSALLFVTLASLPVLAILLGGLASNNKYSLLGAVRVVAQAISYELPIMFSLLGIVVLASSLNLNTIVLAQTSVYAMFGWFVFPSALGFIVMFTATIAELNRSPFDFPEAESEFVGGYNTEYSGMRFAFFFLAEYALMFVMCLFLSVLFLGGYLSPFGFYFSDLIVNPNVANVLLYFEQIFWLLLKTFALIFVVILIRASYPRLRVDKMTEFAWKILLPLSILNFFVVAVYKYLLNIGGAL